MWTADPQSESSLKGQEETCWLETTESFSAFDTSIQKEMLCFRPQVLHEHNME